MPPGFQERCDALAPYLTVLPDKPHETVAGTVRALWHMAAGTPLSVEAAGEVALPALDAARAERLDALIAQRLAGVPLAHLTGRERFLGLDMLAGGDALIPRRETELLALAAIEVLEQTGFATTPSVVDLCTGSGNVALAVAHRVPRAKVFASDVSDAAITLARRNARHLRLDARVEWRTGDLLSPFDTPIFHGNVDIIICNPPYISSARVDAMPHEIRAFEPREAFDGGGLGISIVTRLIREAPSYLVLGGWLAMEVGLGQAATTISRMTRAGVFRGVRSITDAHGDPRVVIGHT